VGRVFGRQTFRRLFTSIPTINTVSPPTSSTTTTPTLRKLPPKKTQGKEGQGKVVQGDREEKRTLATAPLDALYHTKPGRGRETPTLAMLTTDPPRPWEMRRGTTAWVPRKTDLTLTPKQRSKSASVTVSVGYLFPHVSGRAPASALRSTPLHSPPPDVARLREKR